MNLKTSLKLVLTVVLLAGWNVEAATPPPLPTPLPNVYLVFSGTGTDGVVTAGTASTKPTTQTQTEYLVLDLGNPSSFSVLGAKTGGTYSIHTRILSADGSSVAGTDNGATDPTTDPTQNLIYGVTNLAKSTGYALFRYSGDEGTDAVTINSVVYNYIKVRQVYMTGLMTGFSQTVATTIVAADTKAKVSGVYTVPAMPAITNYIGVSPNASTSYFPTSLTGQDFKYEYLPSLIVNHVQGVPPLYSLTTTGTITMTLNTTLTSLANVGGSFKLTGQSPVTINPVAGPLNASSSATIYEDFLYQIVQSLGLTPGYVPSP